MIDCIAIRDSLPRLCRIAPQYQSAALVVVLEQRLMVLSPLCLRRSTFWFLIHLASSPLCQKFARGNERISLTSLVMGVILSYRVEVVVKSTSINLSPEDGRIIHIKLACSR